MKQSNTSPIVEAQHANTAPSEENSQIQLGGNSGLKWNYRKRRIFTHFDSEDGVLSQFSYPRIKKISNGDLLMVFQNGQISESVYMTRSRDNGITWEKPVVMRHRWFDPSLNDMICYATGELLELQNGSLLYACSVRGHMGYRANRGDGIEVMISNDYGMTWGDPILAYSGANWEPHMIQLPTGEIQMYFTQQAPYFAQGLWDSVDVGLVRSYDNGRTWSGKMEGEAWRVHSLSRLTQNGSDGQAFSDGMPVALVLNAGKGIVYACESLKTDEKVSIVYSSLERNWNYPEYTPDSVGPGEDRRWNAIGAIRGYAPYLIQMPSGETVLSFNTQNGINGSFLVGLGNEEARDFSGFSTPFSKVYGAYWGATALKNAHTVMAVVMAAAEDGNDAKHILYAEGQLNHTIIAQKQTICIDGDQCEWKDDSVLFVGSESQAQATIRVAYDDANLYLLIERLDEKIIHNSDACDAIDILLNLGDLSGERINPDAWKLNLNVEGVQHIDCGGEDGEYKPCQIDGVRSAVRLYGTVNDDSDTDVGFVTEVLIPWESVGGIPPDRRIGLSAVLYNTDGADLVVDAMTGEKPKDWYSVVLG